MVPVLIGCPPGKRLAFDITYTLEYNRLQNKHYFDCVNVDPEMPCFLFRDSACPVPSPHLFTVLCPHHWARLPSLLTQFLTQPLLFPLVFSTLLPPLSILLILRLISSPPDSLQPHSLLPFLLDPRSGDRRFGQFSGQVKT